MNGEIVTGLPPRRTGAFVRINALRFDVERVAPEVTDSCCRFERRVYAPSLHRCGNSVGKAVRDRNQMCIGVTRGRIALLNDHTSLSQIVDAAKAT